jgi:hypothetical protein
MLQRLVAALFAVLLLSSCAVYSLVEPQARVTIANGLSVQPTRPWNHMYDILEQNVYVWTMDGHLLNTLAFVAGLENGVSILRTPSGAEAMPVFRSTMGPTEIAELFEASLARTAETGAIVRTARLRPADFAGKPGFRFDFTFIDQADDVERRGIAAGTVYEGRLYLIFFHGARLYYFPRHVDEAEAIIRSARIG